MTAENNLKKCLSWVRDAANQGLKLSPYRLYSSHYCQVKVDNFALAEPFTAPRLLLSVLLPRTKRGNHCSEKEWLVFITIVPTL
jgi:hypothetical protein